MQFRARLFFVSLAAALLAGCASLGLGPEEEREHDKRTAFVPAENTTVFPALGGLQVLTDRWSGVLGGAGYRIEVPRDNWNGKLVMYAHGYAGEGNTLNVQNPQLRRHLIENGYAWAASSYSKNFYDVRAGVEDTNALALAFTKIAAANGRPLPAPGKTYVVGVSMGGHITAAAVEDETLATARNKVRYDGAMPMCGVLGDTELFDFFGAYQLAAQQLAGLPASKVPTTDWPQIVADVRTALFSSTTSFANPTAQGARLKSIVMNLTGGARPIFDEGFSNDSLQNVVWGTFGRNGDISGILNRNVVDTQRFQYRFDASAPVVAAFNAGIAKSVGDPRANAKRRDGLRWIPKINGEFRVPVLTMHTLGDAYVPFHMEQLYLQRATAKGSAGNLVQRAIRSPAHCDFTVAEQARAFNDLVDWVEKGVKPAGDDVLTAATVANPNYGCAFTDNRLGPDESNTVRTWRAPGKLPACRGP
jgi:pimeloyl-ACP methyl ester carboxylesterase